MELLDGKKLSDKILDEIKTKVAQLKKKPALAVILANNNPASKIYVNKKEQISKELGYNSIVKRFDENVTQKEIIDLIKTWNNDPEINGILVQLPLFNHLIESEIIEAIDPKKDVDGFHPVNIGKLTTGLVPYAIPCTPKGIIRILKEYNIELDGKKAVVIGRSNIVGKPTALLLLKENATVTLAHSKTKNLAQITREADILVSAIGKANFITKDFIKDNAVVIDVGINKDENNKLKGDVDFEGVKDIVSAITPVPKGIGPMTIASLMENTLELFINQQG